MTAAATKRRTIRKVTDLFNIIQAQQLERFGIRFIRNRDCCVCTFKFPEIFATATDVSMALARVDLEINMRTRQVKILAGKLPRASQAKPHLILAVGLNEDQPVPELGWYSPDGLRDYRQVCCGKPVAIVVIERTVAKRMQVRSITHVDERGTHIIKGRSWC